MQIGIHTKSEIIPLIQFFLKSEINPVLTMIIMIRSESDLKTHAEVHFQNESYIP